MEFTNTLTQASETTKGRGLKAGSVLKVTGKIWFITAVISQWIFASYVLVFYGGSAAQGNLKAWAEVLPHGIISGDTMGNFALAMHLALAVVILFLGPMQFVSSLRVKIPTLHRWGGRIYLATAVFAAISGFYLIWTRGTSGGLIMRFGTSFNAVLILLFSYLVLKYALRSRFDTHNQWALRLFIAVGGVWFFRVGLMFWIVINQGPVGFDPETFRGPFLDFWTFGQYLLPLAVVELYFLAQRKTNALGKYAVAAIVILSTLVVGIGTFVATLGMWLPRMI